MNGPYRRGPLFRPDEPPSVPGVYEWVSVTAGGVCSGFCYFNGRRWSDNVCATAEMAFVLRRFYRRGRESRVFLWRGRTRWPASRAQAKSEV